MNLKKGLNSIKKELSDDYKEHKRLTTNVVLSKLEIKYVDAKNKDKSFIFQYNPSSVSIGKTVKYADVDGNQQNLAWQQFATGEAKTLDISGVLVDTTMMGNVDVYKNYILPLETMALVQPFKTKKGKLVKRPPHLKLSWGKGSYFFECILMSISYDFTMFDRDGVPIRALLTLKFQEIFPQTKTKKAKVEEVSIATYTVKRFDTLHSIAQSQYGDTTKWKIIAVANGIDNPADVEIGFKLTIPKLV